MKSFYFFTFLLLVLSPFVVAGIFSFEDLVFSVNQSEYYFKVNEDSVIPLEIKNTYGKPIEGILKITFIQKINRDGVSTSSTNSQSISFRVDDGENIEYLGFGTSDVQSSILINLEFNYIEKDSRVIKIDDLIIHFVEDEGEKQNKEDTQKSKSEKTEEQPQDKQQSQQSSTEQKSQQNQMNQDSSALKKQIQRQGEEQKKLEQEFQKELSQNEEFAREHGELLNEGYKLESGNFNPETNNSGEFDLQYKKESGETAEMKGSMEDGEMENLQKLTDEDKKNIIDKLQQDEEFQKMEKNLDKDNFGKQNTEISLGKNKTDVKIEYKNSKNETAVITADVINGTIEKVLMNREGERNKRYFIWIAFWVILFGVIFYFAYKRYFKKSKNDTEEILDVIVEEKPFDYRRESKKLIKEAIKLFDNKKHKDAYEKAGQSLRLYLSYKYDMKKETTNDNIIEVLKKENKDVKNIKKCFDLCSLVEFAKYKSNKKDFGDIVKIAKDYVEKR